MAHDCRRTERFQGELIAALKILQRGDPRLNTMLGAYAGELGQTQFLPSNYLKYGVDYDGDGHVDLRRRRARRARLYRQSLEEQRLAARPAFQRRHAEFQAMRGSGIIRSFTAGSCIISPSGWRVGGRWMKTPPHVMAGLVPPPP